MNSICSLRSCKFEQMKSFSPKIFTKSTQAERENLNRNDAVFLLAKVFIYVRHDVSSAETVRSFLTFFAP